MESFGRYTVVRKIGSGGMAEVFLTLARGAQGTEKRLVVKKIHPALAKNSRFIEMFIDEARVAMRLNHTNIVQVYAFEHMDDSYILAMEHVDGPNLFELQQAVSDADDRWPPGLAAHVAAEAAKGLEYAHTRRDDRGEPLEIVHRDVSPQNILISRDGAVKVTDFGIARARWLHTDPIEGVHGKVGYMSPEQAAGRHVDQRTDVYGLGVVLHELLTGRRLLSPPTGTSALEGARSFSHPSPKSLREDIPSELDAIVMKAIDRDPARRFQTARDMAQALVRFLHNEPEIHDAAALEEFVDAHMPRRDERAVQVDTQIETHPLSIPETDGTTGPTTGGLGEDENRLAVMIAARYEIAPHPAKEEIAAQLLKLVEEMAYKAEGVLRRGSASFQVFLGLPHSSVEDAVHALRLASDVIDATRALRLDHRMSVQVRLAVCRGSVRYRPASDLAPARFQAESELKQSAERLLSKASMGEVLADDHIFRLARRDYNFESLDTESGRMSSNFGTPSIQTHPRAFRVTGAKSRSQRSQEASRMGPFFGRSQGLAQLRKALQAAASGRVVAMRVVGDTGIGKTALIKHFLETAPKDVRPIEAQCLFAERDRPLASAVAAVRACLDLGEKDGRDALVQALERVLPGPSVYRRRQVDFFSELFESKDHLWNRFPQGNRQLVLKTAFGLGVLLSQRASHHTSVLVVDDAQWLDGPSVDIIYELARLRSTLSLLVLFVGHPSTLAGRHIPQMTTLELEELDGDAMHRLITARLGTEESMDRVVEQIKVRSGGNPLFANEIIDSLIERGILVPDETAEGRVCYAQAAPGTIRLPETMEGIASGRIDALPVARRAVLRTASALGASFGAEVLRSLLGRSVKNDLALLETEGFLRTIPGAGSEPLYRFSQPSMRQAAYNGLPEEDMRRIHQQMASRLISDKRGDAPALLIAWHLDRSGDPVGAGRYYLIAAKEATEIYSDLEALKLYNRAIARLPESSKEVFDAIGEREKVLRDLGRFDDRRREVEELHRIARHLGEKSLCGFAQIRRARIQYDLGEFVESAQTLRHALELAIEADDAVGQMEAVRLLAYVAVEQGHLIRALDCANRAMGLIPSDNERAPYFLARALGIKGFVLLNMGHLDEAAGPLAEALVLFRKLRKRRNQSVVLSNLGLLGQARGELSVAIDFIESAMRIDSEIRDISARGRKLATLGSFCTELGDFEAAEADLNSGKTLCRENTERVGEVEADLGLADLALQRGDPGLARSILEKVGRKDVISRSRLLIVWHRQLAALALRGTGLAGAALRVAEEAYRIALEAGINGEAVHGGVLHGLLLAEAGMPGQAQAATRRATDLLSTLGGVRRAEQVWWLQAQTFHIIGNRYRARLAVEQARKEVARKKGLLADRQQAAFFDAHPLVRAIERGLPEE